ncbi:MAG: hypothetical protein A2539_02660 [Elusimicrobia bacterium RIFOXYD2_FULL_34_15]|nr:MAG: hypothetical protein A2539_02660 [Elusimicrobia bacterium RIFOXYD2_FULL_34_15]
MISLNSKITKNILGYLFLHDTETLYVNEMIRKFNIDKRNTAKKLKELENEGILNSEKRGIEIYYSLNKQYPLFQEYKKIIFKTYGIEHQLKYCLQGVKGVKEAYIVGSYAKNQMDSSSDIDVLVIGNADTLELNKKISNLQKNINRELNIINIGKNELNKKKIAKDSFIENIFKNKKIRLI